MNTLRELNLKQDMPTANEAIKRVTYHIRNGRSQGCTAIKFIHGYGSTGKGGRIRTEVRRYLDNEKYQRRVKLVITGEEFSIFDEDTRAAFMVCDDLRRDSDLERHNNGVTIVVL